MKGRNRSKARREENGREGKEEWRKEGRTEILKTDDFEEWMGEGTSITWRREEDKRKGKEGGKKEG